MWVSSNSISKRIYENNTPKVGLYFSVTFVTNTLYSSSVIRPCARASFAVWIAIWKAASFLNSLSVMAASFKAIFEVALPAAILSVRVAIRTECLTAASAGDSVESLPLNLATMRIPPCHPALVRAEFLCPVARCRYQRLSADWTLKLISFEPSKVWLHCILGNIGLFRNLPISHAGCMESLYLHSFICIHHTASVLEAATLSKNSPMICVLDFSIGITLLPKHTGQIRSFWAIDHKKAHRISPMSLEDPNFVMLS